MNSWNGWCHVKLESSEEVRVRVAECENIMDIMDTLNDDDESQYKRSREDGDATEEHNKRSRMDNVEMEVSTRMS